MNAPYTLYHALMYGVLCDEVPAYHEPPPVVFQGEALREIVHRFAEPGCTFLCKKVGFTVVLLTETLWKIGAFSF